MCNTRARPNFAATITRPSDRVQLKIRNCAILIFQGRLTVIRKDYYVVNRQIMQFFLNYFKLVLRGFLERKPLLRCSNEDFFKETK